MCVSAPIVRNYKVHFKIRSEFKDLKIILAAASATCHTHSVIFYSNFAVLRLSDVRYCYIIYHDVNYVNLTGIKSEKEIKLAIVHMCNEINLNIQYIDDDSIAIDNITASGKIKQEQTIDLYQLKKDLLDTYTNAHVIYNRYKFPGLIFRIGQSKKKKSATIIIFNNSSYTIVGAKCIEDIQYVFRLIGTCVKVTDVTYAQTAV